MLAVSNDQTVGLLARFAAVSPPRSAAPRGQAGLCRLRSAPEDGSERPKALVGLERQGPAPHRLADLALGGDLLLGLAEDLVDPAARHDHEAVAVSDDPVAGRDADTAHDDRDVAVGEQLPARDAVLRGHVARE